MNNFLFSDKIEKLCEQTLSVFFSTENRRQICSQWIQVSPEYECGLLQYFSDLFYTVISKDVNFVLHTDYIEFFANSPFLRISRSSLNRKIKKLLIGFENCDFLFEMKLTFPFSNKQKLSSFSGNSSFSKKLDRHAIIRQIIEIIIIE